jgi:hypothetical protein
MFPGEGIRVPGIVYAPMLISRHLNISTPVFTGDILPTMMALLQVPIAHSDNPTWIIDGLSLLDIIQEAAAAAAAADADGRRRGRRRDLQEHHGDSAGAGAAAAGGGVVSVSLSPRRSKPIPFSWAGQNGIIDNDLKLINSPSEGQCPGQPPYFNAPSSSNSDSDAGISTAEQEQLRPRRIREDDNVGTPPSLAGFYMFNITRDRCGKPLCEPILWRNDQFAKAGSGHAQGNAEKKRRFLRRHELHDLKQSMPAEFHRMKALYDEMLLSILHSATNETGCLAITEQPPIMPVSSLLGDNMRAPPSASHRDIYI